MEVYYVASRIVNRLLYSSIFFFGNLLGKKKIQHFRNFKERFIPIKCYWFYSTLLVSTITIQYLNQTIILQFFPYPPIFLFPTPITSFLTQILTTSLGQTCRYLSAQGSLLSRLLIKQSPCLAAT